MALYHIFLISSFFIVTSASYSHMPLAKCDQQNLIDLPYEDWSSLCPSLCPSIGRQNATMLSVLKLDDEIESKGFLLCSKVETIWTFEETWTLSKLTPTKTRRNIFLSYEELIEHISSTCPDYSCNQAVSDEVDADYHWASVTKITKITLSCLTVYSLVVNIDGEYFIKYQGDVIARLSANYSRLSNSTILIWSPNKTGSLNCPYVSGPLMECYGNTIEDSYYCLGSAIFLGNLTYTRISGCNFLVYKSMEGVYVRVNYYKPTSYVHEILLEPSAYVDTWVEALAYDFDGIITGLQQKSCYDKCSIEGIAMSLARDNGWFLFETKMIVYNISHFSVCIPLLDCRITTLSRYCPDKNAVELRCGVVDYWWTLGALLLSNSTECTISTDIPAVIYTASVGFKETLNISSEGDVEVSLLKSDQRTVYYPDPLLNKRGNVHYKRDDIHIISLQLNRTISLSSSLYTVENVSISETTGLITEFTKWWGKLYSDIKMLIFSVMLISSIMLILCMARLLINCIKIRRNLIANENRLRDMENFEDIPLRI